MRKGKLLEVDLISTGVGGYVLGAKAFHECEAVREIEVLKKKVCVICCCYNEAENINELYKQIVEEIDKLDQYEWSILFADNCSSDGTVEILRSLAARDKRVKVILNQANYGASRSSANAITTANADAIIGMASDLEEPPSLIPHFLRAWESGSKVVLGQYSTRDEGKFMHFCRGAYYKMMNAFSKFKLPRNVTGFGLYDKDVIDNVRPLGEYNLVMRFLCIELGYEVAYVPYDKPKRKGGKSSFSLMSYYHYAIETLTLISDRPLHLAMPIGFVLCLISLLAAIVLLIVKLFNWNSFDTGITPVVISIFFVGGLEVLFLGVIGEYLARGLRKMSRRPYVIEKERINFED